MKKEEIKQFAQKNGSPIASEPKQAKGKYLAKKVNSVFRIIAEISAGKWKQIDDVNTKCLRWLCFVTVELQAKNAKDNVPVQISVPLAWLDLAENTVFSYDVDENGYTRVSCKPLTDEQVKTMKSNKLAA